MTLKPAENSLELFEHTLLELFAESTELNEAAKYALFSGGKRLRPRLMLTVAEMYAAPIKSALIPACALEMVHTYSLIHDDLPCMDDDDMRRGKPTLHCAYPEWLALLTGDYLLTYAFELLSTAPALKPQTQLALTRTLANASGASGMIGGQWIDLISQDRAIDFTTLEKLHALKTAALLTAALEFGAIIAEAPAQDLLILKNAGRKIGIAFQIIDDLLDGKQEQAIQVLGPQKAQAYAEELYHSAIAELQQLSVPAHQLESLFHKLVERTS